MFVKHAILIVSLWTSIPTYIFLFITFLLLVFLFCGKCLHLTHGFQAQKGRHFVLDEYLKKKYKVNLIAPHKSNRKKKKTQDGRKLRKYRGRWKIERTFSWLQNFRRFATRYERNDQNFYGILILACIMIVIRSF
ncbi:transposase [Leptospira mayottensis]|uniref:transposase n=1 Tax=Leptospira mayottensis TaxID=1137606 RepID=UPI003BF4D0E6